MADDKKPQVGSAQIPPKKPVVQPEVGYAEPPGPGQKPPRVVTEFIVPPPPIKGYTKIPTGYAALSKETLLPSGKDILFQLPNGDWVNFNEATRFYGGNIPAGVNKVERIAPESQEARELEKTSPQTEVARPLAHEVKPTRTRVSEEYFKPEDDYSVVDRNRIQQFQRITQELPPGPAKTSAEKLTNQAIDNANKNSQEKGEVVPEKTLSVVAKMVGEFKKFYYQGYAQAIHEAKLESGGEALRAQGAQIYAMRYGMHTLSDLHRGLDEASWNFFFSLIGPVGELLEDIKFKKLNFMIKYQRFHYGVDYLIKTLPEEKALDLVMDVSKKSIYAFSRLTGLNFFSKTTVYDQYGNPRRTGIVFTPLLKLQHGLNSAANVFDTLTTEKWFRAQHEKHKQLSNYYDNLRFGIRRKDEIPLSKNYFDQLKSVENELKSLEKGLVAGKRVVNSPFLGPVFKLISRDAKERDRARAIVLARLARTLGFGSLRRDLRRIDRDPLSFIAILIGSWLFDITIGNLARIVAEKIASTVVWTKLKGIISDFFERPIVKNLGLGMDVGKEFLRAAPSLNTVSGGFLGYNLGGTIGQNLANLLGLDPTVGLQIGNTIGIPVGAGAGWGYQWALNLAKNNALMGRAASFLNVSTRLNTLSTLHWQFVQKFGVNNNSAQFLKSEIDSLVKQQATMRAGLGGPGPMLRFANWLNTPLGRFFRIPLKGFAISQLLSPFEAEILKIFPYYHPLMAPMMQYLWEIKGAFYDVIFKPTLGRVWDLAKFRTVENFTMTPKYGDLRLVMEEPVYGYGENLWRTQVPGVYAENLIRTEGGGYRVVQARGWYKNFLEFRAEFQNAFGRGSFFRTQIADFLKAHKTISTVLNRGLSYFQNLRTVGITNFAGLIIGWELGAFLFPGIPLAPFIGAAVGWFGFNPVSIFAANLLDKFGLLPTGGPAMFLNLFNSGFWVGTGIQMIVGMFGINLPWFFPLATGLAFPLIPSLLAGTGALLVGISPAIGAFFYNLGLSFAFSSVLGPFFLAITVGTVAVMSIFTIFVVGSAFWIPFEEQLRGLTNQSPCFTINEPVFSDNKPKFNNGETKDVCWTTVNHTELYQDAINKQKTFDPPQNFKTNSYSVQINTPGGQQVGWQGIPDKDYLKKTITVVDKNGREYSLKTEEGVREIPRVGRGPDLIVEGYYFNIKPPADTGNSVSKKYIMDRLQNIVTDTRSEKEMTIETALQQGIALAQIPYLLNNQKSFLESIGPNESPSTIKTRAEGELKKIIGDLQNKDALSGVITTRAVPYENSVQDVYLACRNSPSVFSYCQKILGLKDEASTQFQQEAEQFYQNIENIKQQEIKDKIKKIDNQINLINNALNENVKQEIKMINRAKQVFPDPPKNSDDPAVQANIQTKLSEALKEFSPASEMRTLPVDSTIKICLNVTYLGSDGAEAKITEDDSASLPIAGPLATVFCQAQVVTPINNNGPGKINCPTSGCEVTKNNGDGSYKPNHPGTDFAGKMGETVSSASNGTIQTIDSQDNERGFGKYVIINGGNGFFYLYSHLDSYRSGLKAGDTISTNEEVGKMGQTGNATGPHTHFAISSSSAIESFYEGSKTTFDPCLYIIGGCK